MTATRAGLGRAWTMTLRVAGLVGIFYETVYEEVDRPWLFIVFLTMMGLAEAGRTLSLLARSSGIQVDSIKITREGQIQQVPPAPPEPESEVAKP